MFLRTKKEVFKVKIKRGKNVGIFEIQPLDPEESEELRKKFTEYERIHGQLMPDLDYSGLKIKKVQKVIKGWDVKDEDGKDISCTDDNKRSAYLLNPDIIDEALEKANEFSLKAVQKKQAKEKN